MWCRSRHWCYSTTSEFQMFLKWFLHILENFESLSESLSYAFRLRVKGRRTWVVGVSKYRWKKSVAKMKLSNWKKKAKCRNIHESKISAYTPVPFPFPTVKGKVYIDFLNITPRWTTWRYQAREFSSNFTQLTSEFSSLSRLVILIRVRNCRVWRNCYTDTKNCSWFHSEETDTFDV